MRLMLCKSICFQADSWQKIKKTPFVWFFFWLFGCGFVCVCVLFFFSVSFFKEKDVNTFKVKLSFHIYWWNSKIFPLAAAERGYISST